jgi:adenylate cyclase
LGDVMDALTSAVLEHDGMVIDYYGDGLAAMWNAPADQADHPELACRAALRMLDALPAVQVTWADVLGEKLRLGVGVHTGVAQVGNAGSRQRWKYGPRGANVHLASRVEAAAKAIGMPLAVTAATAARLSNRFLTYRLCRVALPGVSEPIDLYGVRPTTTDPAVQGGLTDYQRALETYEQGRLEEAGQLLATLESTMDQTPAAFLKAHVEERLRQQQGRRRSDHRTTTADPTIRLDVK